MSDRGSPGEYELMYPSGASPWTSNGAWVDSYAAVHRGDRVLLLRDQHPLPKRLAEDLAPGAGTWKSSGLSGGTGSGLDGPYIGEEAKWRPPHVTEYSVVEHDLQVNAWVMAWTIRA